MSAVRRVRALLRAQDKRAGQSARDRARRGVGGGGGGAGKRPEAGRRQHDLILAAARAAADGAGGRRGEEAVVVRGAGRAVDKVLRLAAWFDGRAGEEGVAVRLATGSVAAIDDIAAPPPPVEGGEAGEPLPESRVRQVSVLEARISRR
jgi:ribonuclease P/MRP protein subunit POP7